MLNTMDKKHDFFKDIWIFDAHCDTANVWYDSSSYFVSEKNIHFSIEKARRGGLVGQFFALYVNPVYAPNNALKRALLLYQALERKLFSSEYAMKVTSTSEMQSALNQSKLACWYSLEGGHIIENSLDILDFFYQLGIRSMTLTHSKNTDWADSSADDPEHDGLTKFGKRIIAEMNKLGMVIDVSHTSDKTVEDVLEVSTMPIMASHSCARSICNIPRNLSDELIGEIARRHGFIGVNFYPGFLDKGVYDQLLKNVKKNEAWFNSKLENHKDNPDKINKAEMQLCARMVQGISKVNIKAVINHIAHIADIGGTNCVGIGSDFDGIPLTPSNLSDVSCYPALIQGLYDQGFSQKEIKGIMGSNLLTFLAHFDRQ